MADIPKWPAALPRPTASGYGYQPKAAFSRTDMDAGNARQRRRFRTFPTTVPVTWVFTRAQLDLFEAFVHFDIGDATSWFAMPLANARGLNQVRARFTQDPPYTPSLVASDLGLWTVAAQLETMDMPVMGFIEYVPAYLGDENFIALAGALHNAVNVVRPAASSE